MIHERFDTAPLELEFSRNRLKRLAGEDSRDRKHLTNFTRLGDGCVSEDVPEGLSQALKGPQRAVTLCSSRAGAARDKERGEAEL